MGGPLIYLLLTRLKNTLKSFLKSPGKLIYLIFMVAIIAFTIFSANSSEPGSKGYRDIGELWTGVTALYTVMFVIIAAGGFSRGGSMFTLSDVNLVFTAPISPRKVLFYALFRQMGRSVLVGIFILFQYSWTHMTYGISYGTLLLILLGYALAVFLGQITAMVIYSFTSGDERRKSLVQSVFYAVFLAFAVYAVWRMLTGEREPIANLVSAAGGTVIHLLPVGGWLGWAFASMVSGSAGALTGFGISLVYLLILVCLVVFSKHEYYEDVLQTAETIQSLATAAREGRVGEAAPLNVKLGKTGLRGGFGANTFYYKHLLENRRSRKLPVSTMTLVWMAASIALAFFMKSLGIAVVFITTTYMQIFSATMGRINKELSKPYIYLVPEPSFTKLIHSLREMVSSALTEALLIFVPIAFILDLSPFDAVLCIAARMSFAMLFTSGIILIERIWSGVSKTYAMLLYMVVMLLISVPGIVLAVLMTSFCMIISENFTILCSLIACNIPVSLLVLFLCRDMLQYAEYNY